MNALLDARQTALRLPWKQLVDEITLVLQDTGVHVPSRLVQPLAGGGSLFVMPALDGTVAITKLITFTPANTGSGVPTIQGDVVVFDVAQGSRRLILDGPTVTARRTAAVSALAARLVAPVRKGPLLIVGAGVQGKAHLEVFADVLGVSEVMIASRTAESAQMLALYARTLGLSCQVVFDANAALADCAMAVTCTPASGAVLSRTPPPHLFLSAVGAFTPKMVELSPAVCRYFAAAGTIVLDTADAAHESGDLIQAGLDPANYATLADVVRHQKPWPTTGPVLFKSCGWAGWDLAAARTALKASGV